MGTTDTARSPLRWLAAVVMACAVTSCGIVEATKADMTATNAIKAGGFEVVTVTYAPERPSTGQAITVVVVADPEPATGTGAIVSIPAQFHQLEGNVWENFPYHFDNESITITGNGTQRATAAQLESIFGPRPPGMSSKSLTSVVQSGWQDAFIGLIVAAVVIFALLVLRIRNSRRQRASKIAPTRGKYGSHHGHWHDGTTSKKKDRQPKGGAGGWPPPPPPGAGGGKQPAGWQWNQH